MSKKNRYRKTTGRVLQREKNSIVEEEVALIAEDEVDPLEEHQPSVDVEEIT